MICTCLRFGKTRMLAFVFAVSMLASCVSTESPTEYYLLNSTSTDSDAVELAPFTLGIGPVELADYLDQEGIANHLATNQIEYSEYHRWAEPLKNNIRQVLLSNMITLFPNQVVYLFPWKVTQNPDYQVIVDITRFGWFPENRVAILARVTVEDADKKILYSGEQKIDLTASGSDYQSIVAAQDLLLEKFSIRLTEIISGVAES